MEFYHLLNRGVEKRNIVTDNNDRLRFIQGLYLYNDRQIVDSNIRLKSTEEIFSKEREPLINIHAYCLMDNHYHLLATPVNDDPSNLSEFMRKLNMGYAKYFNERHHRTGVLWQGKYKKIHIQRDSHFQYIPYYIHLNPLDKKFPQWRNGKVQDTNAALKYLRSYKWSSFLNYLGDTRLDSILYKNTLTDILGDVSSQEKTIAKIVTDDSLSDYARTLE